jgi:hypothetical protein
MDYHGIASLPNIPGNGPAYSAQTNKADHFHFNTSYKYAPSYLDRGFAAIVDPSADRYLLSIGCASTKCKRPTIDERSQRRAAADPLDMKSP